MEEIWKDVVGYEQFFRVSNLGRVWSKRTNRILRTVINKLGYEAFCTRFGGKGSQAFCLRVHRLVAETFVENISNKPFVNHIDGVKTNNVAENLEWVTSSENINHAYRNGLKTSVHGLTHGQSKLVASDIETIFRLYYVDNYNERRISRTLLIDRSSVSRILAGLGYKEQSIPLQQKYLALE